MLLEISSHKSEKPAGRIRQRNEQRILAAAEQEFAACGFKGASMREIAARAELPKANIHYYFKNKLGLYFAVLSDIIDLWDSTLSNLKAEDDAAQSLTQYIRKKIEFSRDHPLASRIFASEIISGGPNLKAYFCEGYEEWFRSRTAVFEQWQQQGKLDASITPSHLIFLLWSSTQHYADFALQVSSALGKKSLDDQDYEQAINTLCHIILKGSGITGDL
ncbi:TetR/AcrR family transcriptional regulator [Amphritea pacifica]|uniref:TetR family transcriptional regulator C-terminal domain-containing protein n=1 Tax=Amphritea pacifica TaxID=2811233 RepID=A0ABS2WBI2_9GAMM|nr:TetR/AcrR family transcriptional regulator [Amphritea pacifica]MBN0989080.1 TetR family transcriptional regulator C-terminal domain-containing protein [Amphritea pacifica]MBN1008002.1 TetR family transcriptional regulator C-terminal domain-containing protein [Amphritea pacifica]